MIKIPLLLLCIFFSFLKGDAQKKFTVIYEYDTAISKSAKDTFGFGILKPLAALGGYTGNTLFFDKKIITNSCEGSICRSTVTYNVGADTICAIVLDGFGHETFAIPGDVVTIHLSSKSAADKKSKNMNFGSAVYKFTYKGKNRFIYSLFDSLEAVGGNLRFTYLSFNSKKDSLSSYYQKATGLYNQRKEFLKAYCSTYKITGIFKKLVIAEINSAYFKDITDPLSMGKVTDLEELPSEYLKTVNSFQFNNSKLYFSTALYETVAPFYWNLRANKKNLATMTTDAGVTNYYATVKRNLTGEFREQIILEILLANVGRKYNLCDSLLSDYISFSRRKEYVAYLKQKFLEQAQKVKKINELTWDGVSVLSVLDTSKNKHLLLEHLKGDKFIIIDCWASWCKPCLKQMDFSKKIIEDYGTKVALIYLSFDSNTLAWKRKVADLNEPQATHFILPDHFRSDFAMYFNITGIPRYIILDKQGKVINANAPYPSDPAFKALLDKLTME